MLTRATAILLMFTLLTANFTQLFVYAGFELNQKYIAATLCENKDKPQLHCEGKCYLSKKLKQAEEKEKRGERESQKNLLQEAFIAQKTTFVFQVQLISILNSTQRSFYVPQHTSAIFHPPQV